MTALLPSILQMRPYVQDKIAKSLPILVSWAIRVMYQSQIAAGKTIPPPPPRKTSCRSYFFLLVLVQSRSIV